MSVPCWVQVSSRCLGTTPRGNGCKVPITTCPHYHDCQAREDPWEAVVPMGCDLLVHFPLCNLSALRCSPVCVALGRVGTIPWLGHKSQACPHTCGCARCLQCPSPPLGSLWRGTGTARAWCLQGSHLWAAAISQAQLPAENPASRGVPTAGHRGLSPTFGTFLVPSSPMVGTQEPACPSTSLWCPFPPQGHRDTPLPLSPGHSGWHTQPLQVCSWAGLTKGRTGTMEASAHPCPLEAPFCAAPGELA